MRILFLTENFPPEVNAAASRVYERALHWVHEGNEVTVITCAPNFPIGELYEGYENRWYQEEEMDRIRVVRVKTFIASNEGFVRRTLDFLSFLITGGIAGLFQRGPDIVVATSPQFFTAVAGWWIGFVRRIPFVFELGDLWPASITAVGAMSSGRIIKILEKLELFLYRRAAAVVALTGAFKKNLVSRGIDSEKVFVVLNGVELSRYQPAKKDASLEEALGLKGRFVVGYIGTHGMAHDLLNVVKAAVALREREPGVRFLFVGAGAAKAELEETVARQGLRNVLFVPPQAKSEIARYWSLCDVALIHLKNDPVFAEVIPSKIFEAMAMGLPLLIAAPPGEATAIIDQERAGLVVPPEDPAALAEAVAALNRDRGRLADLAAGSLAAAPRYSRQRQAREMMAVLKRVARSQAAEARAI